jgi:hypothetical protein
MDAKTMHITAGSAVVDPDGKRVGEVEATREDHLVVRRGTFNKTDLYVPIDHLSLSSDGSVAVSVPADLIDAQGWSYPPNAGFEHERPAYPEVPETTTSQAAGYSAGRLSAPEPQGAVFDDQTIEPGEVPNADIEADEAAPGALEQTERS